MADNVFYTRFLGQMFSSHFPLKRIPNNAFYTNAKNVLYTMVYYVFYTKSWKYTLQVPCIMPRMYYGVLYTKYNHVFSTPIPAKIEFALPENLPSKDGRAY